MIFRNRYGIAVMVGMLKKVPVEVNISYITALRQNIPSYLPDGTSEH